MSIKTFLSLILLAAGLVENRGMIAVQADSRSAGHSGAGQLCRRRHGHSRAGSV